MALMIKRKRKLFPRTKRNCLLITKEIFKNITENEPLSITNLNIDIAFKVAWTGYMKMGKLTYIIVETKKTMFIETGFTKSNIFFIIGDQYTIISLKWSKTDTEHTKIQIILVATSEQTCPVAALRKLFIQDRYLQNAPLFML